MQYEEPARKMLDAYLQKVKVYVSAAKMTDPEEVIQGVTEHIESELADVAQPIAAADLEEVLTRLGKPETWVNEDDITWWRKFLSRLRGGPENWRLAYITAGLVFLGILVWFGFSVFTIPDTRDYLQLRAPKFLPGMTENDYWKDLGRYNETMRNNNLMQYDAYRNAAIQRHSEYEEYGFAFFIFCLLMSFLTAQASLSAAGDSTLIPAGQKWLTYPSLLMVYLPVAVGFLIWPAAVGGGIADGLEHHGYVKMFGHTYTLFGLEGRKYNDWVLFILAACIAGPIFGIWFITLGIAGLFRRTRNGFAAVFHPFLNPDKRWISLILLILGVVFFALGCGLIFITDLGMKIVQ